MRAQSQRLAGWPTKGSSDEAKLDLGGGEVAGVHATAGTC